MKKLAIAASIVAALASVSAAQAVSTGTITFNGLLTATTCDVSVDGQGADATVTLPTIGTNQLAGATDVAGQTSFVMALSQCAGTLQTASAFFEAGATVDPLSGRLKNTVGAGRANNVQLQLRDGSSAAQDVIAVGDQSQVLNTTYVDISSSTANLPYSVEYYATAATSPGTVQSSVVYSIQYQ